MAPCRPLVDRLAPTFAALGGSLDFGVMERQGAAVYGVLADDTLAYYNPAWVRFAQDNGLPDVEDRWPLGRSVHDAVSRDLQRFHQDVWAQVRQSGLPWRHRYECSSPSQQRHFWMNVLPLTGGALLIVNALIAETPFADDRQAVSPALEAAYRNEHGYIRQCSYCRRSLQAGPDPQWHWVPAFLDPATRQVTHGMCEPCFEFYLADVRKAADDL